MTATRTQLDTDGDREADSAWRNRCRRAIEENGYRLARGHGDCPG